MHCNFGNATLTEINSAWKKTSDVADLFDGAPFKSWQRKKIIKKTKSTMHRTPAYLCNKKISLIHTENIFRHYKWQTAFLSDASHETCSSSVDSWAALVGAHSVLVNKTKHHHPVSCVCPPVLLTFPKAAMSQFCAMPAGERKKCAAAICREVHGTNGMVR